MMPAHCPDGHTPDPALVFLFQTSPTSLSPGITLHIGLYPPLMVSAGKATIAGPQAKPDAAKRQDARRPVKRPKLKASPTPATPAVDATFTSRAQPDASTQTVSRIASPEKKRQLRPHGPKHKEIAPPSEDGHAYSAKATCAAGLIKTTHNGSATPTASPASSLPPKFYAFGWDALPTLASVNEVCRDFLHGQCRFYERCTRIHPRGKNLSIFPTIPAGNNPPTANAGESISAEMVKDQHKGNLADVNSKAQQGDSPPAEASDVSRPSPAPQRKSSSLTDLAKSGIVLRYQPKRGMEVPIDEPSNDNDPPIGQRPPPQSQDTCIQWLRDRCKARYACKYRHDDLEYDLPKPKPVDSLPMNNTTDNNATMEGRTWTVKVHDHAKIRIGPGFDIHDLETGFETPWLYLGNVPAHVTDKEVVDLLQPFGEIVDVKLPIQSNNPTMLVRARFTTPVGARDASTALHGAQVFGGKITARLPVHVRDASHNNATFTDTSVRIRWEAPSRTAYCGYSTMELAEAGMQVARKVFRDRYVHASVHIGLPVVGVVTIRFRGLPIDVNKEDMAWFAKPDDVVWAQPNYQKLDYAKSSIKRLLQQDLELLDFFVLPPPYKHAQVQAWAHFASPNDAKTACSRLHCRKPVFTGKTRIFVEHVQSLAFSVPSTTYGKIRSDIQALCQTVFSARRTSMSVVERPAPMATLVKLSGDDLKELGQLKVELEKILNWETIRQGASIAWDPFFAHPAGQSFLGHLERNTPNVTIHVDILRRMIRLLGSSKHRSTIREQILDKLTELQMRQIHTVPLDGWLLGQFMRSDLAQLQVQFGRENVDLDFHGRRLVVRGNETVYQGAKDAIHRARQVQLHPCRRQTTAVCPVCFDAVTKPVTLPCGHSWCRDCITHYLTSSINNKYFPLTCLGKNAKCTEYIPLQVARKILTIPEFDAVVDAAYAAYVQARSGEFHYCPTPDCPQIYRHAPRETVLQYPEGDTNLFRGWMKDHDVKPCPGCKVLIERAEGQHSDSLIFTERSPKPQYLMSSHEIPALATLTEVSKLREIVKSGEPSAWDDAWQADITPWDAGDFQPPLKEVIESGNVDFPRQGHALVPGCGSGYDAIYIASALHLKTLGMDISETALSKANSILASTNVPGPGEVSFAAGDFFALKSDGKFGVIYDYTFFVAIPPTRRAEWGKQMASLIKAGGYLITLVYPIDPPTELGPPFFVRVEHYEDVLQGAFTKVFDKVPTTSSAKHVGKERIVVWKRTV
ncbi:hypothetical protein DXG01_013101 [Tephrocybe rancida]|nr:hypothetical protein DXG01_013101 [Tephrocybe rancida]